MTQDTQSPHLCHPQRQTIRRLLLVLRLQQEVLQARAVAHHVHMMTLIIRSSILASQTCLTRETYQRHPDHRRCLVTRQGHCRTSVLVKFIAVYSAVTMNFVVRITMPHQHQLVHPRMSVMTMVRAVVILKSVVPIQVPR